MTKEAMKANKLNRSSNSNDANNRSSFQLTNLSGYMKAHINCTLIYVYKPVTESGIHGPTQALIDVLDRM